MGRRGQGLHYAPVYVHAVLWCQLYNWVRRDTYSDWQLQSTVGRAIVIKDVTQTQIPDHEPKEKSKYWTYINRTKQQKNNYYSDIDWTQKHKFNYYLSGLIRIYKAILVFTNLNIPSKTLMVTVSLASLTECIAICCQWCGFPVKRCEICSSKGITDRKWIYNTRRVDLQ